jgi:hypothetical protein
MGEKEELSGSFFMRGSLLEQAGPVMFLWMQSRTIGLRADCKSCCCRAGQFAGAGAGVDEGVGWADDGQREGRTRRRRYRKRIAMRTRPPMKI